MRSQSTLKIIIDLNCNFVYNIIIYDITIETIDEIIDKIILD